MSYREMVILSQKPGDGLFPPKNEREKEYA